MTTRRGWVLGGGAALLAGAALGWALTTVLAPPAEVLDTTAFTYASVSRGEVGSSVAVNTVAAWSPVPVGRNAAAGTVTTVVATPGQEVGAGAVLYTVDLRPVVIAEGSIPAFRPLARDAAGADVAQLQTLLAVLGFYGYEVDGQFDGVTERAVEAWQESTGIEPDGVVQTGDIIYVPSLPTRVSLDIAKVVRGAALAGGEEVVRALPATPTFTIPATAGQAALMPVGTRIEITGPNAQQWEGFVDRQVVGSADDSITVLLVGGDGAPICLNDCSAIPVTDEALLRSRIITVEPVDGLTVPSAALVSTADGSLAVIDDTGARREVTLVTSAKGMAVITGVPPGTLVRVPAEAE